MTIGGGGGNFYMKFTFIFLLHLLVVISILFYLICFFNYKSKFDFGLIKS